jgi:hypothetical protein
VDGAQANTPMSREQSAADKLYYYGDKRRTTAPALGKIPTGLDAVLSLPRGGWLLSVWDLVLLFFCPFSLAAVCQSYGVFIAVW